MITVTDGWCSGSLLDDAGRAWPVVQHQQMSSRGPLEVAVPNLILHTTETDSYVETLRFPSQWQCGEGKIGQHIRLGLSGDAVNLWDGHAQQIEMVGRSQVGRWLPGRQTLGPTVALVAWLHRTNKIRTGLKRPTDDWPIHVDRLPAAVTNYYRRTAGLWPGMAGVYGHIEIPGNSHWDPGGYDYDAFFPMVRDAIQHQEQEGDELTTAQDIIEGSDAGRTAPLDQPPPSGKSAIWRWAYNESKRIRRAELKPEPGTPGKHEHGPEDLPPVGYK